MILGKKYEGPEVDIWSIGVILFALLCGHLPFDDENIKELYKKIASGSFVCPPYLSASAKHLIQRLITVDPKKRATLDEVLNHAWVNDGYTAPPYSFLAERPIIRDPSMLSSDIVNRLQAFGYNKDEIDKAFLEEDHSKPHPIRATYFLLSEMLAREEKRAQSTRRNSLGSQASCQTVNSTQPPITGPSANQSSSTSPALSTTVNSQAPIPLPSIITTSTPETISPNESGGTFVAGDPNSGSNSPTGSMNAVTSPNGNVPGSVGCSLYSISEDESSEAQKRSAKLNAQISASSKGAFVSMPQVIESNRQRRTSVPCESEISRLTANIPTPIHLQGHTHSANTLQIGPYTAPPVMNGGSNTGGLPSPIPSTPLSAGHPRENTLSPGKDDPKDGKGRRFSLASLTSGTKRRSSTTPAKGIVPVGKPSEVTADVVASNGPSQPQTESRNDSVRAVNSWFLNVETTSAKPPFEIITEVKRVLSDNDITFAHDAGYVIECKIADLVFEIEICKVPRLSLFGLHFKRISGGLWSYKKLCNKLLGQMNL
jgi:MAP/microtubule affinity-regulating kinase